GLKTDRTLGPGHKGNSQESQDKKCKHFVHHIFFLLLINMLEAPPGTRTLNTPTVAQPLCQPRNWNPGRIFLSNFKTKHSWPREKGLEGSVQTDTGGV